MKTLLFALLLVAFLFKDPVKSLECYTCGVFGCYHKTTCSTEQKFCCKQHNRILGVDWYGCVQTCTEEDNWKVYRKCCTTNLCNINI